MARIAWPIQRIGSTSVALALTFALPVSALASPPAGDPATTAPVVEQPVAEAQPQPQPVPAPVYVQPTPAPAPMPVPVQPKPPNRGLGLTIAGFSMFGLTYLISAGVATVVIDEGDPEVGRPMLIPAVGPFVAASRTGSASAGFALGIDGVVQIAGLAMGIAGAVLLGKSRAQAKRVAVSPGGLVVRF
jgi:hypothetical protein